MTVRTFTAAELDISPWNARTSRRAITETGALEASILRIGLILPLAVHPMKGSKKFGVYDGGRRFRAIRRLIERGELPADFPIDASVREIASEAELLEISTAVALVHVDLLSHEVAAALAKARRRGATLEEICEITGQTATVVQQYLCLGTLADPLFAAYADGALHLDHAKAFAATEDQQLQLAAFEAFQRLASWERTADTIRRLLKVGDREEARLLRFVGEEAFRAAGGAFELDMFADAAEHRGRVDRPGLLRELVEAKLEDARVELRRRTGRDDLRFAAELPRGRYGDPDIDLEVVPRPADAEIVSFIQDELFELGHARKLAETDEAAVRIDAEIAERNAQLRGLDWILPTGDIYATLLIEDSGELEIRWWWASHKAKRDATSDPENPRQVSAGQVAAPEIKVAEGSAIDAGRGTQAQQQAAAAARSGHGLTAEGVEIARAVRREILRAAMVEDGGIDVAHDYLVWQLLRHELGHYHRAALGARGLSRADDSPPIAMADAVLNAVRDTTAHGHWAAMLALMRGHPSIQLPDTAQAFAAFLDETLAWKQQAAAVVAAMSLAKTANLDGYSLPVHDLVAQRIGIADDEALRDYWEPTEAFVQLLPRARRIEAAEPFVDAATRRNLDTMKAADTVTPVTRALLRACWVHPALQFHTGAGAAELTEAAA